ncbi:MAG: dolichol-phosphate mannosyltransferase [Candidatus Peregrinibacteria bacterium Greene0416_19]|nr:MAG: dolichol-phosphate mannosyltransferase [Candidatus Peregrinibacteria bacterium Greene0416_19]
MTSPIALSVVVPLFNEQEVVDELVSRIAKSCHDAGVTWEAVLVNDGSTDATLERLVRISGSMPELRVLDLLRNFGHMPALSAGLASARGEAVIVMDGDLQDPPELIPLFIDEWRRGAEVVYGLRTRNHDAFLKRHLTSLFYWFLSRNAEARIPRHAGTFCLLDRRVVQALNAMPERQRFFAGLRAWVGGKQAFVEYERAGRARGKSRVGIAGLFRLARMALVSFTKVPLRYASMIGMLAGFILFCVGMGAIIEKLFTNLAIPGWATSTTMIGFLGFLQSFLLAVLAEYIAVIFDEVKQRPLYLVREEIRNGAPTPDPSPSLYWEREGL